MTVRWSGLILVPLMLLVQGISTQDDDYFDKCCKLGTSWAGQKLSCDKFTGPVAGVKKPDQNACLETVDICCRKAYQRQHCQLGKADAKAGLACTRLSTGQRKVPVGLGDIRRDCCEGCKLGIKSGSSGYKSCEKKVSFGEPWDPAFTECCEEKLGTSAQAVSTGEATVATSATTATTTDDDDRELEELFKEMTDPTFTTQGDLCRLMKGLLCTDICVPTSGSYYCKCREGSVLQPDGRSCESPTTTARAKAAEKFSPTIKPTTKRSSKTTIKATTRSPAKTKLATLESRALKTTQKSTKNTDPTSALTTLQLLTSAAKTTLRTTRSLTTEDNELNQSCPKGYRFNSRSNTCDDVDECNDLPIPRVLCPMDTACRNNNGSYDCLPRCEVGYRWDSSVSRCVDVDECLENTHKCVAETENCRNLEGSFECEVKCDAGYIFNRFYAACLDINECTDLNRNPCPQTDAVCVNRMGGYECTNLMDYQNSNESYGPMPRNDTDYDGVIDEGRDNKICANGFTYNSDVKLCYDIDECELLVQPCAQGEVCRNTVGGYDCVPAGCHRGFTFANDSNSCVDVDECQESLHACLPSEICRNTNGSFTCEPQRTAARSNVTERPAIVCRKGYKADYELDGCVDVDECAEGPGCRDHERCVNYQGTYDCSPLCGPGWYFHMESKTCEDVDECMLGHHLCRQRTQYCRNTNGSYACEPLEACSSGYRRSQNGSCVDVDECQEALHSCSRESHRYCVNRDGGYECITRLPLCSSGFEYSLLTRRCQDVDECRNGKATCDSKLNERCINLPGTYKCERQVPQLRRVRPACPNGTVYDVKLRMCAGKALTTVAPLRQ